ncbi:MAG: F0F1 ATP synthase subunit delta [bacterium]|nr:F0F1 ATP synthase subunit delta [bacterium]
MINSLFTVLLIDFLDLFKAHPDIFRKTSDYRKKLIFDAFQSDALAEAFPYQSEAEVVDDLLLTVRMLTAEAPMSEGSSLVKAFSQYLLREFPSRFDQFDRKFLLSRREDQMTSLMSIFPQKTRFSTQLRQLPISSTPQDISEAIVGFLQAMKPCPRVLVQSAVECTPSFKQQIRTHFLQQFPTSFLTFQVNHQLIGGLRFFIDGKVRDLSWFSKIQALTQFTSHL